MEQPDIYYDRLAKLSVEDKQWLRDTITNPVYVKYMRVVAGAKPSVFNLQTRMGEHAAIASTVALSEIRGWELYEQAIFAMLNDKLKREAPPEATYPDSARLDVEPISKRK